MVVLVVAHYNLWLEKCYYLTTTFVASGTGYIVHFNPGKLRNQVRN